RWLPLTGVVLCLAALAALLWQTALTAPGRIWILVVMVTVAFAIEFAFRLTTGRALKVFRSGQD
ncbi:MAG: amino acid transporter, partial [Thiogranum sp.]